MCIYILVGNSTRHLLCDCKSLRYTLLDKVSTQIFRSVLIADPTPMEAGVVGLHALALGCTYKCFCALFLK